MTIPRSQIHFTFPRNDAREHEVHGEPCWCNPRTETIRDEAGEPVGLLIHHVASDWRTQHLAVWAGVLGDPTATPYLHGAN